jgi:pimeloyl-ACP methyl ester carboxylesterase
MRGTLRHLSVGVLALTTIAAAQAPTPAPGSANFVILVKGARIGSESVSVDKTADGWRIVSTSQQAQPVDLQQGQLDLTYSADWAPRGLSLSAVLRGQPLRVKTTFADASATSAVGTSDDPTKVSNITQVMSPRPVVLPSAFYGAFEALAARLPSLAVGSTIPLFLVPDGEVRATVTATGTRTISTPAGRLTLREFDLTVATGVAQPLQIWIDEHNRLAQLVLATPGITVAREDLATVMAREERTSNPGDTALFIPILGFSAGATVTVPASGTRHPAVILVPGFGSLDRDAVVGGVPVYGLLAGALAADGDVVVRYDRRGLGQSGGRTENMTLEDYRDDLIAVINGVRKRKDVDGDRIAVIGYQDGGAVALLAAAKDGDIKAVGLVAVPGTTGRDYVLEEQARMLATLPLSDADRAAKVTLQKQVLDASLTGRGWENLPADVTHDADRPVFKSWLLFDPIKAIAKVDQPILVLQGLADVDVPQTHADRLLAAARARKRPPTATRAALLPSVTHTLTSGAGATPSALAGDVNAALTSWLREVLRQGK